MAGIGLYGVFTRECVKENGVVTGYTGDVRMIGKAISANFEHTTPDDNPLAANNGIAENSNTSGSGGTLTTVIDRLTLETAAALFGTTVEDVSVQVGDETVTGMEISYKGDEQSKPQGVAYIKLQQEDGVRQHEVVFYREGAFSRPDDSAQTIGVGGSIEWQTPELSVAIAGLQGDGSQPWVRRSRWTSQEAALAYIYLLMGTTIDEETAAAVANELNDEVEDEIGV